MGVMCHECGANFAVYASHMGQFAHAKYNFAMHTPPPNLPRNQNPISGEENSRKPLFPTQRDAAAVNLDAQNADLDHIANLERAACRKL